MTLTLFAVGLSSLAWLHYLWLIPQERVPERPLLHSALQLIALLGAIVGFLLGGHHGWVSLGCGIPVVWMGGLWFWLLTQARLPDGEITVHVGSPLRPFTTVDADGVCWSTDSLQHQRVLLKFFRGHW